MGTATVKQCDDFKAYELDPKCDCMCHIGASVCRPIKRLPQPQQSETTFEAWWSSAQANCGHPSDTDTCCATDMAAAAHAAWKAALRSRQVAPEVVEQLADTIVRWFTTPNDERFFENGKTYVINRITEAIAQPSKSGGSNV